MICRWCGRHVPFDTGSGCCGERCLREWNAAHAEEREAAIRIQRRKEEERIRREARKRAPKMGSPSKLVVSGVTLVPDDRDDEWNMEPGAKTSCSVSFGVRPPGTFEPKPPLRTAARHHLHVASIVNEDFGPTGTLRLSLRILEKSGIEPNSAQSDPDWTLPLGNNLEFQEKWVGCSVRRIPLSIRTAGVRKVYFAIEELNEDGAWHIAGGAMVDGTISLPGAKRSKRTTKPPSSPRPPTTDLHASLPSDASPHIHSIITAPSIGSADPATKTKPMTRSKHMNCPSCNAEIADTAKFCPECGEKIVRKTVCPDCGTEVASGAKFCAECGHKFVAAPPAAPDASSGPHAAPRNDVSARIEDHGAVFLETSDQDVRLVNVGVPTKISILEAGYDYHDGGHWFTIRVRLKNESEHDAAGLDIGLVFYQEKGDEIIAKYDMVHAVLPGRTPRAGETTDMLEFKDLELEDNPPTGTYRVAVIVSEYSGLPDDDFWPMEFLGQAGFAQSQQWNHDNEDGTVVEVGGRLARTGSCSEFEIEGCSLFISKETGQIGVSIRSLVNRSHRASGSLRAVLSAHFTPPTEGDVADGWTVWSQDLVSDSIDSEESVSDLSVSGEPGGLLESMEFFPVLTIEECNADGNWYVVAQHLFPKIDALKPRRRM